MRRMAARVAALGTCVALLAQPVAAGTASGTHGAVATDQRLATQAGIDVLRAGGNAVDAAVAIGYTLAVTYPEAGNLGGGGFMLVRRANGAVRFYDFRETAPAAATAGMYLDANGHARPDASIVGALAAGVPGTVAGLEAARAADGTRSRHELLAQAIAYAEKGFTLAPADADGIAREWALLRRFPATAAILGRAGKPLPTGALLRQPALARTLRAIDRAGAEGFYRGDVARRFAAGVRSGGGIITTSDLAAYRVKVRAPIRCDYRGATVYTAPPPSSGGIAICEITKLLGPDTLPSRRSEADVHAEVEAERRAFADRNTFLGDPDFVAIPLARLLSTEHIATLRASIRSRRATPSTAVAPLVTMHEGHNTTHYSVIDAAGNAVAVTYTLNATFGSGAQAGDTGVLLNDEMDDFTTEVGAPNMFGLVQGAKNAIAPGKRPLSSMSPTIVVRDGKPILVTGAAGGPRIITTTLDIVRDVVGYGMSIGAAEAEPRMHHQWLPDVIDVERNAVTPAVHAALVRDGYALKQRRRLSLANTVGARDGIFSAANDPRQPSGSALAF
jgi:gamma-glutamyltranspeptidase/glutathione hydrolase